MIPASVNISTVFQTVIDIKEQNHIIELKFDITLEWYESRAKYHNLKTNTALNVLKTDEVKNIWIPYVIFQNTDANEAITIEDVDSTFYVTREGRFVRDSLSSVDEAEVFEGVDNKINMVQTHSKKFHSTYLLHNFPFDTQVATVTAKNDAEVFYTTDLLCPYDSQDF